MRISHLSLTNFRNYTRLELDFPPGVVILQGDNAQGKTNLLEAVYLLSRLRSPRTGTDRELVNWLALEEDLPFARLVARVEQGGEETALETSSIELSLVHALRGHTRDLEANGSTLRKSVRVNGVNRRAPDAVGLLNAVLFLPQDIELVAGSPSGRRRYLDDTICQIDSRYSRELQSYSRVLTERNYLLKSMRGRRYDPAELAFWDQHLVEHGAYLTARRQQVIRELDEAAQRIHLRLTGEAERLRLEYDASVHREPRRTDGETEYQQLPGAALQMALAMEADASPGRTATARDVAAVFAAQLRDLRGKEVEQGMSLLGPHRDELRFRVNGVDMNIYGSRGQQRTTALSLKLAEVDWLTQQRRDKPVLLLDDVISELDGPHRSQLLAAIDQAQQVLMTTTDLLHYSDDFLASATLWRVTAGRIGD
jgi:DNA replication and repair protein RecF